MIDEGAKGKGADKRQRTVTKLDLPFKFLINQKT